MFYSLFDTVTGETLYSSCGFPQEFKQKKTKAEKQYLCYSSAIQRIVSVCSGIISVLLQRLSSKYYFNGLAQRNLRASKKANCTRHPSIFITKTYPYSCVNFD